MSAVVLLLWALVSAHAAITIGVDPFTHLPSTGIITDAAELLRLCGPNAVNATATCTSYSPVVGLYDCTNPICACRLGVTGDQCEQVPNCDPACVHGYCLASDDEQGNVCACYNHWCGPTCETNSCPDGTYPSEDSLVSTCVCANGPRYIPPSCTDLPCPTDGAGVTCGSQECVCQTSDGTCVCAWYRVRDGDTGLCRDICDPEHTVSVTESPFVTCHCADGYDARNNCSASAFQRVSTPPSSHNTAIALGMTLGAMIVVSLVVAVFFCTATPIATSE